MVYNEDDKAWSTDYSVDDVKELVSSGAIPKDFIEVLPGGVIQISAFVILTLKSFMKTELGEDWAQDLGDYLYAAASDPNLNDKIKEALGSILDARTVEEVEPSQK